jgi:hypothetical protein
MDNRVSPVWKYVTFGLGGLIVAQAVWWNYKAPQVLGLGGGY